MDDIEELISALEELDYITHFIIYDKNGKKNKKKLKKMIAKLKKEKYDEVLRNDDEI